jgi:hypothetical protein
MKYIGLCPIVDKASNRRSQICAPLAEFLKIREKSGG